LIVPSGQHKETFVAVGPLDGLHLGLGQNAFQRLLELRRLIAAIGVEFQ
jgi:hypothetical protein